LEKPANMKALIAKIEAIQAQKLDGRPANIMGHK